MGRLMFRCSRSSTCYRSRDALRQKNPLAQIKPAFPQPRNHPPLHRALATPPSMSTLPSDSTEWVCILASTTCVFPDVCFKTLESRVNAMRVGEEDATRTFVRLGTVGQKYEPELLEQMFANRKLDLNRRAVEVAGKLGLFISSVAGDLVLGSQNDEKNQQKRAKELTRTLSDLGPSFVKLGQALSLRPDLLPKVLTLHSLPASGQTVPVAPASTANALIPTQSSATLLQSYLEALSELQDGLDAFDSYTAFELIESQLGRPLESMYSHITSQPVAAASLGQVYKATLAATGETVAVKVQRPGIGDSIAIDMLLLRQLLDVVDKNQDFLAQPLVPLVDEFSARLFGELDYIQEGHQCERFAKLYSHVPKVTVPSIYWDYTSRLVLTMEWIDGVKLTNKPAMDAAGQNIVDFVDIGIECTLRQLLEHGYFHADPHPGNMLATPEGNLAYLDFGMMSEAPEYARYAIIAHVVHLVNRDYQAMCRDYYTLEFMDKSVDTSPIAPALANFFDDVLDDSVAKLNFKSIVDGLGSILLKYPFQVPAYYALILRSLTVLEGLALSADPEYKLLAKAYPYMAQRLLTDPSPELRETFEELMLQDGQFRWSRLINLMQESRKSLNTDPERVWLIAEWFFSDDASHIRGKVEDDLVRMADASLAAIVREGITANSGSVTLATRFVPAASNESRYLSLAQELNHEVQTQTGLQSPLVAGGEDSIGFPNITAVPQYVQGVIDSITQFAPKVAPLFQRPAAQQLMMNLSSRILQRMVARSVKVVSS